MSDELSYYRSRLDELTGQVIRADSVVSRSKRELGQRRKALAILSDLQHTIRVDTPAPDAARAALAAASQALKMDRAVLLTPSDGNDFVPTVSLGYTPAEDPVPARTPVALSPELTAPNASRLVTAASAEDPATAALRSALRLPYFVAVPVIAGARCAGVVVAGRLREQKPFYPPLDEGDLSTWQAVAGFLGAQLLNAELFDRVRAFGQAASRFVPTEFLELLGREDITRVAIGDQLKTEITVLFSDIRGFTSLSERMTPEETFRFVNGYLAFAAPVIRKHGGFIDKYIGDAIMALFPADPHHAVLAGLELQQSVAAFNATPPVRGLPPIAVGVGVHTGPVMLGTTGFEDRLDCTVISDSVNLASRLEGLTKYYGSGLIVSADTMGRIPAEQRPAHRLVDRVKVKGRRDPVDVIDVYAGDPAETRALKHGTRHDLAAALTAYAAGQLDAANVLLASVLERHPEDLAAHLLASRVAHYRDHGLPPDWQGVVALDAK